MDFLLVKINDVISHGSIRIFNSINEPVIIEVQRRMDTTAPHTPVADDSCAAAACTVLPPGMETVATQTDKCEDVDLCYEDFYDGATLVDVPLTELDLGPEMDGEEDLNRTLDFEYEEVTLTRTGTDQKVGLTLCYGSACDEITDIFVGEVDPAGIAAKDGRIREGDQILQINGCDVHTRHEAVRMFSSSKAVITLLLARPAIQMDDGFMDIYNSLDDFRNRIDGGGVEAESVLGPAPSNPTSNQKNCCHVEGKASAECQKHDRQSSAVHSTDDVKYDHVTTPNPKQFQHGVGNNFDRSTAEDLASANNHRIRIGRDETVANSIDCEIDALNREMQRIQLQYQEIMAAHRSAIDGGCCPVSDQHQAGCPNNSAAEALFRSPRLVPRMGTRLDCIRQLHLASEHLNHVTAASSSGAGVSKTSPRKSGALQGAPRCGPSEQDTSAYNTGESCRSTPAAAAAAAATDDVIIEETTKTGSDDAERSRSRMSQTMNRGVESLQRLYNQYIDVMYTNKANLQHTIMVQQNLFQQQLARSSATTTPQTNHKSPILQSSPGKSKGTKAVPPPPPPTAAQEAPCPSGSTTPSHCVGGGGGGSEMEWVVKRRADGSRYITRRPIRNRILKERARKLAEERCGLTTDDDAISELKIGRYWSKEERKRHLEKARNHRRQKELLLRQQMENSREKMEVKKELNAVELGHRKHLKHKSKKALDDFTTIQELLVHGSRDAPGKAGNALLSVTTV